MIVGAIPNLDRELRLGTLEITAVLALVALIAGRPRVRAVADIGALTPMNVDLEILRHGEQRVFRARTPFEVGRAREVEVPLRDPEVSRHHARFTSQNRVVYLEDLESSNGTFLNGRRVTEAIEVRKGDMVDVGTTRLLIRSVRAA